MLVLAGCLLMLSGLTLYAQPEDVFSQNLIDRASASLPLPYGFVASGALLLQHTEEVNNEAGPRYGIAAYYDTWQLGLYHEQYGNIVRLMNRSVGRDFVGFSVFLEAGQQSYTTYQVTRDFLGQVTRTATGTDTRALYGIGTRFGMGHSTTTSFIWAVEFSASNLHMRVQTPLGVRIPLNQHALQVNIVPSLLSNNSTEDNANGSPEQFLGIGISTQYAINFESE